ncbi:unnamed protein product [Owenia fusiformis]|uniref:Uncharacterized protein n=1 Tax=Owenia fusiformis TaxID=6347 RepID=A0A8J1TDT4_OWEFU|nr:unnamed protein product [Owenia fusiformis]
MIRLQARTINNKLFTNLSLQVQSILLNNFTMPASKRKSETTDTKETKPKKIKSSSKTAADVAKSEKGKKKKDTTTKDQQKKKPAKKTYTSTINEDTNEVTQSLVFTEPIPTKNSKGQLVFKDAPEFQPNMTPKEVLQAGSFGGTYFRPIKSGVTKQSYTGVWKELPKDWTEGLDISRKVISCTYRPEVNTYKVKCGGSLEMWEDSGWIHKQDPYGWFMWYCRFYQGRRTEDDERQIGRWLRCAGVKGRWRNNLIGKCARGGCSFDNHAISPVVRQTLQHWGYRLNEADFKAAAKRFK